VPRVDVLFGIQQLASQDVQGRVVAMIDVLRASTTIAVALHNGARTVIPLESPEEVVTRSKQLEKGAVRLAGERRMLKMEGFDLGNSPLEHTPEMVDGKTVLFATTNGTKALLAVQGARDVVVASYVNLTAAGAMLRTALRGGADIAIVCAGQDRQFALEDAACAGRYVHHLSRRLADIEVNDAALAASLIDKKYGDNLMRLFDTAAHGRALAAAGFRDDLAACAAVDSYPVVPIYQDRQITKLGPERER
jgi:2-phosphosulfolactate phosphatase